MFAGCAADSDRARLTLLRFGDFGKYEEQSSGVAREVARRPLYEMLFYLSDHAP